MKRYLLVVALAAVMLMASAGAAFAGEWNKGHFNDDGGNLPAKYHANSECLFNGQDEPDATEGGGDDAFWSITPAGSHNQAGVRVQSGGQGVAIGAETPGVQGVACNGHLNGLK
jgi:hypothetical protein